MVLDIGIQMLVWFIILLITSIPLFIAVKLLGGRGSLLRASLVNFLTGLLNGALGAAFGFWGLVVGVVLTLWIWREFFRLRWFKAFLLIFVLGLVWLICLLLVGVLLGVSIFAIIGGINGLF